MASVNVYDLNYTDAFVLGIKNYANFKGRASRSEYWRFMAGMMMVQGTKMVMPITQSCFRDGVASSPVDSLIFLVIGI